jgi:hypothetical protein
MEVPMTRRIHGLVLGGVVLAFGLVSAGCGSDTGTPPPKDAGKKVDMGKMKDEMMKQRKDKDKSGATGPGGEGEKDKNKPKDKDE